MENNNSFIDINNDLLNTECFSNNTNYNFLNHSVNNLNFHNKSKISFNIESEFYEDIIKQLKLIYGFPILFFKKEFLNKSIEIETMNWSYGNIEHNKYNDHESYDLLIWNKNKTYIKIHKPSSFPLYKKDVFIEITDDEILKI